MAQPIPLQLAPRDPRKELLTKLEAAPAEHAAALLDSYELIQQLHEQGIFAIVRGALGAKDKIVEAAAETASSEEAIRATRNTILLAKMLGSIDPEILTGIAGALSESLGDAKDIPDDPPGMFSLLRSFTSAPHRRGLAVISSFLGSLGARWQAGGKGHD